jgi:hypothetical protein
MNTEQFDSAHFRPQLNVVNEVPNDGLELLLNRKKKAQVIYYQCLVEIVR